jgi:aspartate aminotransferase-like enzyme
MSQRVALAGGVQAPYFRDDEFASRVISAHAELLTIIGAPAGSELAILSSSGSGAMEAAMVNFSRPDERILVINGGSFGQRFSDIGRRLNRNVHEFKPGAGVALDISGLHSAINKAKPGCVFVNAHETSTGQLFDLKAVSRVCAEFGSLLICDAVSTIACDPFDMNGLGVNVVVFSANKGLALSPGAAFVVADEIALARRKCTESYYLDLGPYFEGNKRGQPPFTSAVSVIAQLFERLEEIRDQGGIESVILNTQTMAETFRSDLADLGYSQFPETPSNAITAFVLERGSSNELYDYLKNTHDILINKSAWGLGMEIPRVAHAGALTGEDHAALIAGISGYLKCT